MTIRAIVAAAAMVTMLGVPPAAAADVPAAQASPAAPTSASVAELDLGDGAALLAASAAGVDAGASSIVDSGERSTAPFEVMGVSWAAGAEGVAVRYRTRTVSGWSAWSAADAASDGQGTGSRVNTDALVAGPSDGVQVVVAAASALRDVKVVLVDPGADPVGWSAVGDESLAASTTGATMARPTIISRAQWGADESWRTCEPDHTASLVSAAVHHTVSSNTYTPDQVAGIIRGIYAYHVRPEAQGGRGWCDIGYNAVVDRFGRIYEARAHSFDEDVAGVHTGGFNSRTFGVSVIGDFSTTVPSDVIIEGVSQAIAWKFAMTNILAGTSVTMISGGGASKYPQGTAVTFPTIYGHRDAQWTACPGQQLYDRLGLIRDRVAQLSNAAVLASPAADWERTVTTLSDVTVSGWTFDPDADTPLTVDVLVDGQLHRLVADQSRPDVAQTFGTGDQHGFDVTIPLASGRHAVCLWARNVGAGNDRLVGCRDIWVRNADPVGFLDLLTATAFTTTATGWALDADTADPIGVHVYVDGAFAGAGVADGPRPDVAAAYPAAGDRHGYVVEVPATPGTHEVCTWAINVPEGYNPLLGCGRVTVSNATPFGFLDAVSATQSSVRAVGWAIDPDTGDPIDVRVLVNGVPSGSGRADQSRPDVEAAFPGSGDRHGFDVEVPTGAGRLHVCAQAINTPVGTDPMLGCATVTVVNATPTGFVDQVAPTDTGVHVLGWALDADTTSPIAVHVYIDGSFAGALTADAARPDVAAAFPGMGAAHGFDAQLPVSGGRHEVCISAINAPMGFNPLLRCVAVTRS